MGSLADLWCLQSGRGCLLRDLLLPLPSVGTEAYEIRHPVSSVPISLYYTVQWGRV